MKISVVIPTYKRDASLAVCLEALRGQVDERIAEVVVTDDAGPSSPTAAMVAQRFPFARWVAGPHRGPAANRNHGATLTTGEFVLFLDDDVEPGPTLINGYARAIDPQFSVYEGRTTCRAGLRSPFDVSPVNETGGWLWSCNLMVRRSLLLEAGGFDEQFPQAHMEDVAFRDRLKATGARMRFVPEATVDHPPRRLPGGRVLARQHESYILYQYKYAKQAPSLPEFVLILLRFRTTAILTRSLSADSFRALASMAVETAHVLKNWRRWDAKWKGQFTAGQAVGP
ncbi:MAG: glycosyltransferase family 2 protein [Polyangia bacterium]